MAVESDAGDAQTRQLVYVCSEYVLDRECAEVSEMDGNNREVG